MKYQYLQNLFDQGLLKGGKALDLGYGNGHVARFLLDRGFAVQAVDIGAPKIEGIEIVESDIRNFTIPENTYNFIHARNVLTFLKEDEIFPMIEKMYNGLMPNGVLYFTLFGQRDEWYGVKDQMTFVSDFLIDDLETYLSPLKLEMSLGRVKTMDGGSRREHLWTFTCVKS